MPSYGEPLVEFTPEQIKVLEELRDLVQKDIDDNYLDMHFEPNRYKQRRLRLDYVELLLLDSHKKE